MANDNRATPMPNGTPCQDASTEEPRGGHAETPKIVSKWRRLDQFDPKSQEYILLLNSLIDNEVDRKATTSLEGDHATVVLDILDKALCRGRNFGNHPNHVLRVLRNLAYHARQVPSRHKIDRSLVFDTEPMPFASGGFSDVRRGRLDGQLVAVKVLRVAGDSNVIELQRHFCKETVLWKNISHQNILGLIAVDIDDNTGRCIMISEYMVNRTVFEFIQNNSVNRLRLLADVSEGLHYLHDRGIFHGDIKAHNILVTNATPPRACISDFGFSTPASTNSFRISTRGMNIEGGTPPYMAPELMYPSKFNLPNTRVSREGDIFAFGMVMYEVVTGVRPFGVEGMRHEELMFVVIEGRRPTKPENAEAVGFGKGVWDLMEKCWSQDRTQRPKTWDVRLRLTVAASMSSVISPGPTIAIPQARNVSTGPTVSNASPNLFNEGANQSAPDEPGAPETDESGYRYTRLIPPDPSMVGRSIILAKNVAGEIHGSVSPTVQRGFGMFKQLQVPKFIVDVRERLNFASPRNLRLRRS